MKKNTNNTREIVRYHDISRFVLYYKGSYTENFSRLLEHPDSFLSIEATKHLKDCNSSVVSIVTVDGKTYVVKKYAIRGFWHGFKTAVRASKAMRSWDNAHLLASLGIATPRAVAVIEARIGFLRRASYLITEHIEGRLCGDFFINNDVTWDEKKIVAEKLIGTFHKLALAKVTHGDMKGTNIIISDDTPILTDLDALKQHQTGITFAKSFKKDIRRFMRNWNDHDNIKELFKPSLEKLEQEVSARG